MAFDRKDYGMNWNIPFIKIANRVEVNVSLKWKRVSGPPPVFQSLDALKRSGGAASDRAAGMLASRPPRIACRSIDRSAL